MPPTMKKTAEDFAHIPGWGIDADPDNEPTYPNRQRTGQEHDGRFWVRPLKMWNETVIVDGKKMTRFTLVEAVA